MIAYKNKIMNKFFTFLLLFLGLLIANSLNGQVVTLPAPSGGDANDPSLAANNPTGVACAGGGFEEWINFDGVAGNNDSEQGGTAIGARHNQTITYTFPAAVPAGDYLLFYEQANPGLLECDGTTMLNGNGFWRFNIGNGNVNGTIIPGMSTPTMEWSKASVSLTATADFTTLTVRARRNGATNPYMQIDNIILVTAPAGVCDGVDLGSPALNACYGTGDFCYPTTQACASITPGVPHMNPAGCVTAGDPDPNVIIPIPDFDPDTDCAAADPVTFDMVVPDLKVHYTYWGNCSPLSPAMPTALDAQNQGFIQQFFCDSDTDNLPAFPGGLSGESGEIDFIPTGTFDTGCDEFVDQMDTGCICGDGDAGTDPEDEGVELIQLDFWVGIPSYQTQVGFSFDVTAGNPADGGSIFVGPNTGNMCEVAYYNHGGLGGEHNDATKDSGTYDLDHDLLLKDACNLSWLRVRVYITDVKDRWGVIPTMDCGNGYGPISALPVAATMNAGDNTKPAALTTMSVDGYSLTVDEQEFLYDEQGAPKKYACNPVTRTEDAGICNLTPTPVELISFDAFLNNKQVTLKWETAAEVNNAGFEIQKSLNGRDWEILGWVDGNGTTAETTTYEYIDRAPFAGDNYYRLKQVDYDGQFEFSDIATVRYKVSSIVVEISPNPSPGEVNVRVLNPRKEKMSIKLYDSAGLLIWQSGTLANVDTWKKKFNLAQKEMYFLSVQVGKESFAKKILIIDKF